MYGIVKVLHVPLIKHCAVVLSLQQSHDAGDAPQYARRCQGPSLAGIIELGGAVVGSLGSIRRCSGCSVAR